MTLLISSLIILPPANPFEHHRPAVGVAALLSRTSLFDQEGHPPAEMGGNPTQTTKRNSIASLIFIVIIFVRTKQLSFSNTLCSWDVWDFTFLSFFLVRINSKHSSSLLYPYSSFDKKEDVHLNIEDSTVPTG